ASALGSPGDRVVQPSAPRRRHQGQSRDDWPSVARMYPTSPSRSTAEGSHARAVRLSAEAYPASHQAGDWESWISPSLPSFQHQTALGVMPPREMLLRLACVLSGLGVALAGALLFSTGHAAHAVCGGALLFALGPRAMSCKAGTRSSGCKSEDGSRRATE